MKNKLNILLVLVLILSIGLACGFSSKTESGEPKVTTKAEKTKPAGERIDGYTVKGFEFVYYKIPANLSREELIETAQKLHEEEPKAQLILVDDESGVKDYIDYAKSISAGDYEAEMPKEWADKHIVANVQKMMSGKFVLYESYGYKEIAELK
jgi:hypothetical protein